MEFKIFKETMQKSFELFIKNTDKLFVTNVEKDVIWDTYLNAFPEDEKQSFSCNCCKQFLRPYGNLVKIVDNKLVSIWDFKCEEPFQSVVDSLNALVLSQPIKEVFISKIDKLGIDKSRQQLASGEVITWHHIQLVLPKSLVTISSKSEESLMGEERDFKNVFKRSLEEITLESVETVLELINQNSIYRGQEFKGVIEAFLKYKNCLI